MSRYIFVSSEEDTDYAKTTFKENYKGDLSELWEEAWNSSRHETSILLKIEDFDAEYVIKADELDDHTVEVMQDLIDYETDKAYGWIRVE